MVALRRQWFSVLIFGSAGEGTLVLWLVGCLAAVLTYNFLSCIFMAARMYRVATIMQFFQSVGFAAISLALCLAGKPRRTAPWSAMGWPRRSASSALIRSSSGSGSRTAAELPAAVPQRSFWAKLLPFAAWIWMSNLLSGLFDIIDRYMIVHFSGLEVDEALRQVGYYHTSRLAAAVVCGGLGPVGLDDHARI